MKMFCISDNVDTQTGLRLVGIDGIVVHTKAELQAELDKAISDRETGILLINEKLARQFPEIIKEIKLTTALPLIIEIPDRHGTGRSADFITAYIHEAIGLKI